MQVKKEADNQLVLSKDVFFQIYEKTHWPKSQPDPGLALEKEIAQSINQKVWCCKSLENKEELKFWAHIWLQQNYLEQNAFLKSLQRLSPLS